MIPGRPEDPRATVDPVPLCVDLDGTLVAADTLKVAVLGAVRKRPWSVLPLAWSLLSGRAAFKEAVASRFVPRAEDLPWRTSVIDWLREQHHNGRRLILATAAPRAFAEIAMRHLRFFDACLASAPGRNTKGREKVAAILELTRGGPFDYVGDSQADLPVFAAARLSIVVSNDPHLVAKARAVGRVDRIFAA